MTDSDSTVEASAKEFLEYVLSEMVDEKDQLKVESKVDDLGLLLTVQVSEPDMGKLIGKGGQTIQALRTLIRVIGSNSSQRVNLKVLEPEAAS